VSDTIPVPERWRRKPGVDRLSSPAIMALREGSWSELPLSVGRISWTRIPKYGTKVNVTAIKLTNYDICFGSLFGKKVRAIVVAFDNLDVGICGGESFRNCTKQRCNFIFGM
jgi:hypothetical protein